MIRILCVIVLGLMVLGGGVAQAKPVISFEGQIDFSKNQIEFSADAGQERRLTAKVYEARKNEYRLSLNINHFPIYGSDVASQIQGVLRLVENENKNNFLRGRIDSRYTLINYQPIQELHGHIEVRNRKLIFKSLSLADLACSGFIELFDPHKLKLAIRLDNMGLNHFLDFWIENREFDSDGRVSGEIKFSGDLKRLLAKASLESYSGFIKQLKYDSIYLNVEGVYPHLEVAHSTLTEKEGLTYTLEGPIDLSDRKNFNKQIKAMTFAPLVQESASEAQWTIREHKSDEPGSTATKYLLRKNQGNAASGDQDSTMLGI